VKNGKAAFLLQVYQNQNIIGYILEIVKPSGGKNVNRVREVLKNSWRYISYMLLPFPSYMGYQIKLLIL
jgi:hypothetical protein